MSERYQREIEEILKQAGDLGRSPKRGSGPPKYNFWKLVWLYVKRSLGGKVWSLSPGRIMLIAVSLLLAALIVRPIGLGGLVAPFAWAGLLLFIVAYALFFVRPPKLDRRWRGQALDRKGESWWSKFKRKMK